MKWLTKTTLSLSLLAGLPGCTDVALNPPAQHLQVEATELSGFWYQLAALPHALEEGCQNTTMLLLPDDDDLERLDFILECQTANAWKHIDGFFQENSGSPDRWAAHFSNATLNDYVDLGFWVVDLDPEYKLVVFSEPNQNAFWVWSGEPNVPDSRVQALLQRALERGDLTDADLSRMRYRRSH